MRPKDLIERFSGFREPSAAATALLFLHELSAPETRGQPPREARWQRILDRPQEEWGAALDRACRACAQTWPEQLDGFFDETPFASESPYAIARGIEGIERFARHADRHGGPWDRRTLLADISQEMRSLSAKQWQGAFFTPWSVAEMSARMLLDPEEPTELWVLEPCVGGAAMLLAALEVYRERHGLQASRAMTLIGVDLNPRVCQIARASLLLAGADPHQFWVFAGDSLAQPIVGRDRRDGELRTLTFHVLLTNPPFGTSASVHTFATHAERGPLVIPDHVLYRQIPRVAAYPVEEPEPAGVPVAPGGARATAQIAEPGEQLRLPWAA